MLEPKVRAKLRGLASVSPDLVYIGQNGLTETVLKQIKDNLFARELIKVKVQRGSELSPKEYAEQIATEIGCDVVCVIGNKIVLYKYSTKEKIKHVLDAE